MNIETLPHQHCWKVCYIDNTKMRFSIFWLIISLTLVYFKTFRNVEIKHRYHGLWCKIRATLNLLNICFCSIQCSIHKEFVAICRKEILSKNVQDSLEIPSNVSDSVKTILLEWHWSFCHVINSCNNRICKFISAWSTLLINSFNLTVRTGLKVNGLFHGKYVFAFFYCFFSLLFRSTYVSSI